MRKSIFKLMSVVFAMAAVTSCTDDLNLQSSKFNSDADLVATFENDDDVQTRLGMLEVEGTNPWDEPWYSANSSGWSWVFTPDDKVRVFTMASMEYQYYQLIAGAGTAAGEFRVTAPAPELPADKQKYAITDAQFAYAVSPVMNADGETTTPRLTYTIPYHYQAQSYDVEGHADQAVQRHVAPFWGLAETVDQDGPNGGKKLETSLWALTGFLRIQMDKLPKGTQYIVLTTHGSITQDDANNKEYDGFQLLKPDGNNPVTGKPGSPTGKFIDATGASVAFTDKISTWDDNAPMITDGNSEPLSGTFNALLTAKGKVVGGKNTGAFLAADQGTDELGNEIANGISRLVTRDELVIDVTTLANDGIFWIPIIPQHYNNLHVLAVTYMSKYAYKYVGTELTNFHDDFIGVAKRRHLEINMANFSELNTAQLNEEIKKINNANKFKLAGTNIINLDKLVEGPDNWYPNNYATHGFTSAAAYMAAYPMDQILVQGEGNLVINIANIECGNGAKGNINTPILNNVINGEDNTLFISDKNYGNGTNYQYPDYAAAGATSTNSVKINVPVEFNQGAFAILADLPKTNAIFAANDQYAPAEQTAGAAIRIDVHGSATEFASGREVADVNDVARGADATMKDSKDAAVTVQSGFGRLNVLSKTKGDVYIDGTKYDEKVELADGLYIYTLDGTNVRLDNALSKNVGFPKDCNRNQNFLITTGSSAIQNVGIIKNLGGVDAADIEREYDDADTMNENDKPQDLTLLAFWTGYALDLTADNITAYYDKDIIYTAAQLASMGEAGVYNGTQNSYVVSKLLEYIWLGGESYGWVGPVVTAEGFKFNGNGVSLLNMHMPENIHPGETGMRRNIWAYDPHFCCTTCGWNRLKGTDGQDTRAEELFSWGLIREIDNVGETVIKNVVLNDVYANYTDEVCDHIGSLVGLVEKTGNLLFDNDNVGEIRINVPKNDFIGGFAGYIYKAQSVEINNSNAFNSYYETGYIKGQNHVGGMIGKLGKSDFAIPVTVTKSQVNLAGDISAEGSYAGGICGGMSTSLAVFQTDKVKVENIKAKDNYAAGFVALLTDGVNSKAYVNRAVVDVAENIIAENGQFAAGLVGFDKMQLLQVNSSDIAASKIQAENGYVGGEVGYSYAGDVIFGRATNDDAFNDNATQGGIVDGGQQLNKVAVGELAGSHNVGGMVGNNANNSNVTIYGFESPFFARNYSHTDIAIGTYSNTKTDLDAFFQSSIGSEQASHLAGTMSNIVGKVDGNLKINESYLAVEDNLDYTTKEAVGYKYHNDQQPTPGAATRFYWGDANGYVGFGKSGNYYLSETNAWTDADKVRGDMLEGNGFNLYKSEANYNTNSKLVTE